MFQNYSKFPNRNVQTFGFVNHDTNGQNHGPVWKTQSFLLNEICMVILWQDCYGERQFENILLKYGWEKVSNWECLSVHREKGLFLSVYVDDIKLVGKKKTLVRCGKHSIKKPNWENQHLSLIMNTWGCSRSQCETSKDIVNNYRTMFESRISAGAIEKLPCSETLCISSWSCDMESHARNVWSDIVNWPTRRHNNSTKYPLHASMATTLKKKN